VIESIMYFGIGFLAAGLSVLIIAPLVHGRAVRLTARQFERTIPASRAEVIADKDLQRAEFALSMRRLEINMEQLKTKGASQLAELGRKSDAINRLKIELDALRDQLRISDEQCAVKTNTASEAERALSAKESELAKLVSDVEKRSVSADSQKAEIIALTQQVQALGQRLVQVSEQGRTAVDCRDAAVRNTERALSDKESELSRLTSILEERSRSADALKAEIVSLTSQVQTLSQRLILVDEQAKAERGRRGSERNRLDAATRQLLEQRAKFDNFHRRVAELVRQVVAQTTEDKVLGQRTQQDLENRLVEQSRLLNDNELELKRLRDEIEIGRKTEYDLRIAMIESDGRANATAENFNVESARLQTALDRANGERTRLAYELANIRRQVKDTRAA
jgi:chromosome segregation ATPase